MFLQGVNYGVLFILKNLTKGSINFKKSASKEQLSYNKFVELGQPIIV